MIRRVLLAAALLAGMVVVAVPAGQAQARPVCLVNYVCHIYFYSDPARTQLIGTLTQLCNGLSELTGQQSVYLTYQEIPCD